MVSLAAAIEASQRDRTEQTRQITAMNTTLSVLSEQMADDRRCVNSWPSWMCISSN